MNSARSVIMTDEESFTRGSSKNSLVCKIAKYKTTFGEESAALFLGTCPEYRPEGAVMPLGMEGVSNLPRFTDALLKKGYSEQDSKRFLD